MAYSFTTGTSQTFAEFAVSIFDQMAPDFYEVKYPDYLWDQVLAKSQRKTNVSAGAQNYVQPIRDMTGAAQFMGKGASPKNIPSVGLSLGLTTIPMAWSAVSASITTEDQRVYEHGNLGSLTTDLSKVERRACENLIETSVFFGAPEVGFEGWLSYTGITATNVAATGTDSSTLWSKKTTLQMLDDINSAIEKVMSDSKYIMKPGFLYLPPAQYFMLSRPMVVGGVSTAVSALEYIKKNNAYTALTGKELEIKSIRYLKESGAGNANRMVLMDQQDEYQMMPFPLPFTLLAPVPSALGAEIYAEQKFGSYTVFQKGSMQYFDGI